MLQLGEEEELPPPESVPTQRGPYMSPALPTVGPPREKRPGKTGNTSSKAGQYLEQVKAVAGSSSSDAGAAAKRAEHEQRLEQIMAQVAQLEEQLAAVGRRSSAQPAQIS